MPKTIASAWLLFHPVTGDPVPGGLFHKSGAANASVSMLSEAGAKMHSTQDDDGDATVLVTLALFDAVQARRAPQPMDC
jgi:hypothetical protein